MKSDTVIALAKARVDRQLARQNQKAMEDAFKNSPEYLAAVVLLSKAQELEDQAEETFREEAAAEYQALKNKHADAYDIKDETVVTLDEEAAREWCLHNFTPALVLHIQTFVNAAQNGTVPSNLFTLDKKPKVYIHSDLSGYIPVDPAPEEDPPKP